ncbi:hypothetical protein BD809_102544 [Aquimarina intermedia]|uniref:Uncharacterized protein n=1 Tax=Aquimarina intermedia TaxID=350814 RepID=A0A5S5CDC2_9FLAO|nr:hypothetical protein BD809_102544 [Aquimarina intermedia]
MKLIGLDLDKKVDNTTIFYIFVRDSMGDASLFNEID